MKLKESCSLNTNEKCKWKMKIRKYLVFYQSILKRETVKKFDREVKQYYT